MMWHTVVNDKFEVYAPLWAYCILKSYPGDKVCLTKYGNALSPQVGELWSDIINFHIHQKNKLYTHQWTGEEGPSTFSMLRFLQAPEGCDYPPEMIVTDCDILIFPQIQSHAETMRSLAAENRDTQYFAWHGARKKPDRFPGGWSGFNERLAGGLVYFTKDWWQRTSMMRKKYIDLLRRGQLGTYREEDEVILCRLCKAYNMPIYNSSVVPAPLRCIHLGDFKDSLSSRWKNPKKMARYVDSHVLQQIAIWFGTDPTFRRCMSLIENNPEHFKQVVRLKTYISSRLEER